MATLKLRRSNTSGAAPAALVDGEIAINQADGVLFWRDGAGAVRSYKFGDASVATISSDLTPPGAGALAATPFAALIKGDIALEWQYAGLTWGVGVTAQQRQTNTTILNAAIADASTKKRPIKFKRGATLEVDYIPISQPDVHIDLNHGVLRHGGSAATTMMYVYGASSAARVDNFRLYNGTLDGNGHAKTAVFYPLSMAYHSNALIEDITILDPFSTAYNISDPYPTSVDAGGWPAFTSNDLTVRNLSVLRTSANQAACASKPAMLQGDQGVITGVSNPRVSGVRAYYSGRSGLSIGLNDGGYLRDFKSNSCWCPIYVETWRDFSITDFSIRDHMGFDGSNSSGVDSHGIWLCDGDQSASGVGMASCQRGVVADGRIYSMVRAATTGSFNAVRVSGRDGANKGATAIRISNVLISGIPGAGANGLGLRFDGQCRSVVAQGVTVETADAAWRADMSYQTSGGQPAAGMTDCWAEGLSVANCAYAAYATGGGITHTRSGIRTSTTGGGAIALAASLSSVNNSA